MAGGDGTAATRLADRISPAVVVAAVVVAVAVVVTVAPLLTPPPAREESTYGYSLSLSTNATLENVTLSVPLPATANGTSPIAESYRAGDAAIPEPWQSRVVETDRGPVLRLTAAEVSAERRPDGRRYSTYQLGTTSPVDGAIDTGDPFGREPTVAPAAAADRREMPCPNVVEPAPGKTCYSFDSRVYAAYDAPADASVDIYLVSTGVNTYEGSERTQYYERLTIYLDGPQDGWVDVEGFVSTSEDPRQSQKDLVRAYSRSRARMSR